MEGNAEWKEVLNSDILFRLLLKQLFAYCSLFPKDYVFDKEQLILYWMAEGFLQRSDTSKSMFQLGTKYFEELLSRSFFQYALDDKSSFVMHGIMNDLATSVAGDVFSRLEMEMKKLKREALEKGYRSRQVIDSSNKIQADLLHRLPLLRVLSHFMISEVPESIGSLKHLRYLNLHGTQITNLPEIVFHNLQTLIVSGCSYLNKLLESLSTLKNLQHFDLRSTPFLKMPFGIAELKSLRTLLMYITITEGDNSFLLTEHKDLKDLHGKISMRGPDDVQSLMHAQDANFSQKRASKLNMAWSNEFDDSQNETLEKEVLNVVKLHTDNLKKLKILSYGGVEFPNWVGNSSFLRLVRVRIAGCKKCTSLPPLGQLPSLKRLHIQDMNEVKVVGPEFPAVIRLHLSPFSQSQL